MAVEIFIDPYDVSGQDCDVVVQNDRASIFEARSRINENLESGTFRKLTLRLPSKVVLHRFSDFIGVKGVRITYTRTPKDIIAKVLIGAYPSWLTNSIIAGSNLHTKITEGERISLDNLYRKLFSIKETKLSFSDFCEIITQYFLLFTKASSDEQFSQFWSEVLLVDASPETIACFIDDVCSKADPALHMEELAYSKQVEKLRFFAQSNGISIALPPPSVPVDALGDLDLIIEGSRLDSLSNVVIRLFDFCLDTDSREHQAELLGQLPLIPVSKGTAHMAKRLLSEYRPEFKAFTERLTTVTKPEDGEKLKLLLTSMSVEKLDATADVERTTSWLKCYFSALGESWANGSVLTQGIETSFSDWLLANRPRVDRSLHSWTSISNSIKTSLSGNEVVVVYMVDALSGVHLSEVQQQLSEVLAKHKVKSNYCFAPIPTLTEVGKNAVLTGRSPSSLKGDSESVVLQAYANNGVDTSSILTHKSWMHARPPQLNENTKLYLYLENRLDEGLHDSKKYEDYSHYNRTVSFILKHIAIHAEKASKAAERLGKSVKFIVTADHGITRSSGEVRSEHPHKKERLLYNVPQEKVFDEYYTIETDIPSLGRCYVPKDRMCFSETAFAHGGLTPEEVVIPWVEFTTSSDLRSSFVIRELICHSIVDKRWGLTLSVNTDLEQDSLNIHVEHPLQIEAKQWLNNGELYLVLSSAVDLEGLVEVPFTVLSDGVTLYSDKMDVEFPRPIIQKDKGANDFESMFEL